jgi:hypothetical protein
MEEVDLKPKTDYSKYVLENKDKIIECPICRGNFKYYSRTHHNRSKIHQNAILIRNEYENK